METVTLQRKISNDDGTQGVITFCGTTLLTLEDPDRNNESNLSDVLPGTYSVAMAFSAHFNRNLYHLQDENGRTNCMIHQGNWAGDITKGKRSDVEGCILLGQHFAKDENGQLMITNSATALSIFMNALGNEPFTLVITNA